MSYHASEFAAIMPQVADLVFGEFIGSRNQHLSTSKEWRWGANGSVSVDLGKGVWADHEDQTGGGVLDLLRAYKGLETPEALEWLQERGFIARREKPAAEAKPQGKFAGFMDHHPVAIFEYRDDRGRLAYEVLKFAKDAPRRYMQRRPAPGGSWIWGLQSGTYGKVKSGDWFKAKEGKTYAQEQDFDSAPRWLYRRDEVLKAKVEGKPVVLVEGEKDADTVRAWGLTATTNAGGAKYWSDGMDADLAGADVVICGDNDDASRQRTLLRGGGLRGKAKSVRVLDLALHWKDMPEKADVSDWKEKAGGTAAKFTALLKKAPLWKPEPPRTRFGALQWSHLDDPGPELDFLIDAWLTDGERSVLAGPSRSGKSFLAIHAAMCVARGQDFFNNAVKKGGVVYQAGEGARGVKRRLKAYRKHFEVADDENVPFVFLGSKVDLYSKDGDTQALIEEIKAWALTMAEPLRLVVIDTLATATAGADENSGKDMGIVLHNIARIAEETGAHVMLVHHMNAKGEKLRGHSSVFANVDQVVTVHQNEQTKIRTATLEKQKDDEDGLKITFKLATEEVGYNERTQRAITSCVVVSIGDSEKLEEEKKQFGFAVRPSEERILIPLFRALKKYGELAVSEGDQPKEAAGKVVVKFEYFLDVAAEMDAGADDKGKARDRIRKAFEQNNRFLLKADVIGFHRPYVWWTGKPVRGFPHTFPEGGGIQRSPGAAHALPEREAGDDGYPDMIDGNEEVVW